MIDTDVGYCWSQTKGGHTHTSKPFCSDDIFYGHYKEGKCNVLELVATESPGYTTFLTEVNYVSKVVWRGSYFTNPEGPIGASGVASGGASGNLFLEIISTVFGALGDAFQIPVDSVATENSIVDCSKLTYSRSEIEADQELNKKIDIKDAEKPEEFLKHKDKNIIKYANVSDTADDKYGNPETIYTESTEIPVIPVDVYSLFTEEAKLFDLDFYSGSNKNENKAWNFIRNIVSAITHFTIYISAAALITMLIIRSILFISSTFGGNPEEAAKSRDIMDSWVKAIALIAIVFVIMPMIIYFEQNLEEIILNGNSSRYYIRVNVENVYQFNTNLIGYVKYMSLTANLGARVGFSLLYAAIALINFVWTGAMFARLIVIAGLTIIAPFTAINAMLRKDTGTGFFARITIFRNWIRLYMIWTFVPLVLLILLKIILGIII